jgi:DNA-binding response OmpR family regulator
MSFTPKRILVVEDERAIARALQLKLTRSGYTVDLVLSGEEALTSMAKNKYDLVLLDLMMPRLDGFGVLSLMKTKNISAPVMVLSNLNQDEDIKKAKDLGAIDFLIKSDTPLTNVIEKIKGFFDHEAG